MSEPDASDRRVAAAVLPHLDAGYNLAMWLTRDPERARDTVQEAALRAVRFFASFKGGDARPWFLGIVRNVVYSAHEASLRRADVVPFSQLEGDGDDGESFVEGVASPAPTPEELAARLEEQGAVDRLIAGLPVEFKEVLVLRELEELSYKEIAAVVGIPIGTVMSRLSRARALLLAAAGERVPR